MPEPITADRLERLGACPDQVRRFRKLFGDGPAPLTAETAIAHAQVFDWNWAAKRLLTPAARAAYEAAEATAWAAYLKAIAPARAAYEAALAAAQADYYEAMEDPADFGKARSIYEVAEESALAAYDEAVKPAQAVYNEALAAAFAEAYLAQ